ncbi:enterotoxin C [[Bacillus thuringiensis] serovar konkukian]|nr:enterotoxin C [[Bacillus thuringiensis] serovar konkukian]
MNKNLYKKVILSMMIAGMATSNIVPLHTFAAEQKVHTTISQETIHKYSLGPEGFQDVLAQAISNVLVMDSYAKTISNQQETNLSGISDLNSDLRANMLKHQKDAKNNANYWLDNLKPRIMNTNQNIVNYNDTFQAHYSTLLTAIDQKDTEKLKTELEKLYQSILTNKSEVDELLEQLRTFRNEMATDTQNFKQDTNQLTTILASTTAGIPLLEQQINAYNESIKKSNDQIIAGSVLCATLITCIIGGPMIATAKSNIASAEREIQILQARISGAQAEIAIITDAKNKATNMTETIDTAITSIQNMSNLWNTVAAKYNNLMKNIAFITPEEFAFIKEDLNTAKDSWQDLKNYADKLYEAVKIAEKEEQDLRDRLRPSDVIYFYKPIHNAYTFEIKTGANAPNASYKVVNLTKNTTHNMWSGGPNTNMWVDWLPLNLKDQYAVIATVNGMEYVVYKELGENISGAKWNGTYQLFSALNNSSVIDLDQKNNNVILHQNKNGNNQKWKFVYDSGKNAYQIKNIANEDLVLAWNDYQGSNNVFATPNRSYEEHYWIVEDAGNGYFYLKNKKNSKYLDVTGSGTANGTNIIVWDFNGGNNQKFKLQKLN